MITTTYQRIRMYQSKITALCEGNIKQIMSGATTLDDAIEKGNVAIALQKAVDDIILKEEDDGFRMSVCLEEEDGNTVIVIKCDDARYIDAVLSERGLKYSEPVEIDDDGEEEDDEDDDDFDLDEDDEDDEEDDDEG